ncbi:hypothetical protein K6119_10525 [Paracrocinitomix mangrovi]|uniref:hypothetical protein n=1 Tax=Paracrocinitomix mangrovi TaxID=2862509 RepID=UPI001C8DC938|nr:hypothetical protein [Paracrocinitomix mangrovi]UKN00168.1 hypothetical protein K6119_10525 [Paracrocinitomix mangrovi]
MKKLIYISFVFAILLAFTSCEKEVITPNADPNTSNVDSDVFSTGGIRGGSSDDPSGDENGGGGVVDPDEDEDFNKGDKGGKGGVVDPDEDEDFNEEDGK